MKFKRALLENRIFAVVAVISSGSAIATYLFLSLAARKLSSADFSSLSTMWSLIYVVSGIWLGAIEPELTRARSNDEFDSRFAASRISIYGISAVVFLLVAYQYLFGGLTSHGPVTNILLPTGTLISGTWLVHRRSDLAASNRPLRFSLISPFDSVVRIVVFGILLMLFHPSTNLALVAIFIGMTSAAVLASIQPRGVTASSATKSPSVRNAASRIVNLALGASGLTLMLSGLPLLTRIISDGTANEISTISAASTISRAPLILILGFDSLLVAKYSSLVKNHSVTPRAIRILVLAALLMCLTAGALGFSLGRMFVSVLTGGRYLPTAFDMGLFAVGSALVALIIVCTPYLIAQAHHKAVSRSWFLSLVLFVIIAACFDDAVRSIAVGYSVAGAACLSLMYADIYKSVSRK